MGCERLYAGCVLRASERTKVIDDNDGGVRRVSGSGMRSGSVRFGLGGLVCGRGGPDCL